VDAVARIADAVLYEGYVLWPYRRSALKNQRRWTFGGVYPRLWAAAHADDPWVMQTQCLVASDPSALDVRVRFLQVVRRQVVDAAGEPVDERIVDGERLVSWEEAVERDVRPGPIEIPAGREQDGAVVRTWHALRGAVDVHVAPPRVTVRVTNTTPLPAGADRERALELTFCSTHTILRGARFVSLTDPPEQLREEAERCENVGTWPVLVGEETLLSSPIILPDHPEVAPESPGDLFDGGEIDQLLTLSILAMTDEEKGEMRAADPRTRAILERTEALSREELMRLHGRWR
jgi:hydrogenase maturation protease